VFSPAVFKVLCDVLSAFLPLFLGKSASQKANGTPKSKVKVNVLN
jgi:hypothetical protein